MASVTSSGLRGSRLSGPGYGRAFPPGDDVIGRWGQRVFSMLPPSSRSSSWRSPAQNRLPAAWHESAVRQHWAGARQARAVSDGPTATCECGTGCFTFVSCRAELAVVSPPSATLLLCGRTRLPTTTLQRGATEEEWARRLAAEGWQMWLPGSGPWVELNGRRVRRWSVRREGGGSPRGAAT